MAKNSIDAYGAAGKTNTLLFDPASLTLISDPAHPLYDERIDMPLDESMVLNIMALGVVQPITVTKDTETGMTIVVDGRQRVRHAIEANRRLASAGNEPLLVPATVKRGDDETLMSMMISTNEIRQDDSIIVRAQKMRRMAERNIPPAKIALAFGCTQGTVSNSFALLDCCAAVRKAVDAGQVPASAALKLVKLPADQQRQKIEEMVAAGAGLKGHAKARAVRTAAGEKPKMRSRAEIEAKLAESNAAYAEALRWVLGGEA